MLTRGVQPVLACCVLAGLLSACQRSVQGQQLDINYATSIGVGSITGTAVKLPHGRYTFFSSADPPACVTSVALLNQGGTAVADDASQRAAALNPPPGAPAGVQVSVNLQMMPTMVQQELPSGSYRLKIMANGPGCAWHVEQILNYILSNEPPLKPLTPPMAPPVAVSLGNASSDLHFQILTAGIYHVKWSVTPCDRYSGDLVRSGGGIEHLGDGVAAAVPPGGYLGPQSQDGPTFLGAGDWIAKVTTRCFWQIDVTPWVGPLGGGTQGFKG
jgi:hypothetical protein